jgi:hypothetical protein
MSVDPDFSFPRRYEWEVVDELPGGGAQPHYYFPGGTLASGGDGVVVRIAPAGAAIWFGTFAFGKYGMTAATKILSMPDPGKLCVVSCGAGYIVSVQDPRSWESVKAIPVIDVRPIAGAGLVVFANFTELVAYGTEGVRWRTKRLTWDSMKLIDVTDEKIVGEYWDIRSEETRTFEVDVATGTHHGGVEGVGADA